MLEQEERKTLHQREYEMLRCGKKRKSFIKKKEMGLLLLRSLWEKAEKERREKEK
jgi:hypothetical protein